MKPKLVSWLAGLTGLVLLNVAADAFAFRASGNGWIALVAGLGLLAFALWWAR